MIFSRTSETKRKNKEKYEMNTTQYSFYIKIFKSFHVFSSECGITIRAVVCLISDEINQKIDELFVEIW